MTRTDLTLAFFPTESKSRISPLFDATAILPLSVVTAAEKSFLLAYCLYCDSTNLLPSTRGSIRNKPLRAK